MGGLAALWAVALSYGGVYTANASVQEQLQAFHERWRWWTLLSSGVGIALAALLLAAGIGLIRRRRWGVSASTWWAGLKLVYVAVIAAMMVLIMPEQMAAANSQSGPAVPTASFVVVFAFGGAAISLIWGAALPAFMLVYLRSARVRSHVQTWA